MNKNDDLTKQIKTLTEDIEELSIQLSDMLCVALMLSGVKESQLQNALDAYVDIVDKDQQENNEYGIEEILNYLDHLKHTKPELFAI